MVIERDAADSADEAGAPRFSMIPINWLAAGGGVVLLLLYTLQQSLRLPSGYGVEDLLGWSTREPVHAAVTVWCKPVIGRWYAAAVYVLADTAFFMPLYGALILAVSRGLGAVLQTGPARMAKLLKAVLRPLSWIVVALLWVVDGSENYGGVERIGIEPWAFVASVALAVLLFASVWRTVMAEPARQAASTCRNAAVMLLSVGLLALVVYALRPESLGCSAARLGDGGRYGGAWAHHVKLAAILLATAPITFAALVWWFGMDLDLHSPQRRVAVQRAAWRGAVAGVIGRTRYVLLLLVLFAGFTLVLDQCRDVLLALAGPLPADAIHPAALPAWSAAVLLLGAVATGMLAYSCWLWTRLVGMVQRPGLVLPGGGGVPARAGEFARAWARAVALLPLAMFCLLVAHTAGDAVTAAPSGRVPGSTLGYLALFGMLALGSGYVFLQLRRKLSLGDPSDYYNSEPDAYLLLRTGTRVKRRRADPAQQQPVPARCALRLRAALRPVRRALTPGLQPFVRRLVPLSLPVVLPLLALMLMWLVRACMALWPEVTSQAPPTLLLLCLSLVWWMGVTGALALAEQRQTIPWMLVVALVASVLSLLQAVDNHVVPLLAFNAADPAMPLAALRRGGLVVTTALTLLCAVLWIVMTWRPATSESVAVTRPWGGRERLARWACALAALTVVAVALHVVDGQSQRLAHVNPPIDEKRSLSAAVQAWQKTLRGKATEADHHFYLVASEGGGSRAAYWTAQVLAQLHDRPGLVPFEQRAFVLSGVSGGAVGEAVFRACLRVRPPGQTISQCVGDGFARLDSLSPLIGGFLFEDIFAHLLPVHWNGPLSPCAQPACGFMSRALGFEREWMRQFPALAEPLGQARPGEPELMLNSTWVETGNRATLSTMRLTTSGTPASDDVLQRLGAQASLITAAHLAARFPYINPLGTLALAAGPDAGKLIGHLADGGYHDNSGTESLADVWRQLQQGFPEGWTPQLVLIRNGQAKPGCKHDDDEPQAMCLSSQPGPAFDLAAPLDAKAWPLNADLLGPPLAVLNVSGIGARARQAAAAMDADLAHAAQPLPSKRPPAPTWLLDQTTGPTLVPLGWYLSPEAREALDGEAKQRVADGPLPSPAQR